MALPKEFRFRNRREVITLIRSGARLRLPIGVLHYRIQPGERSHRFLAVVPNRVSKESTVRHRWKRRVEGLFSRHANEFPPGFCGVVVLGPAVVQLSRRDLASSLQPPRRWARAIGA